MHFTKVRNDLIVTRSTLIAMDPGRNPKNAKPFLNENLGNCEGLLITCHKSLTVFGKDISQNKDVLLTSFSYIGFSEIYTEELQRLVHYQATLLSFGLCIVTLRNKTLFTPG